jgi:hypothetical protein
MSMSTSLTDLKNNVLNFDMIENLESENDVEDLIKDVEQNLDEKKINKNNYLPLNENEESEEKEVEKPKIKNSVKENKSKTNYFNINLINSFLILVLFLIINHPILNQYLDNLVKIDNYYYKFIIKGFIFVLLINLLKII